MGRCRAELVGSGVVPVVWPPEGAGAWPGRDRTAMVPALR